MKVTEEFLKEKKACQPGYKWFCKNCMELDVEEQITKLSSHRYDWANWLLVRLMTLEQQLQYAIFSAEQVLHIFEKKYPDNKRPRNAIEAAKKVLKNDTEENIRFAAYSAAAADAAYAADAAAAAADAAYSAAADAAYAADAADAAYAADAADAAADAAAYASFASSSAAAAADAAADAAAAAAAADAAYSAAADAAYAADEIKKTIINYGIKLIKEIRMPKLFKYDKDELQYCQNCMRQNIPIYEYNQCGHTFKLCGTCKDSFALYLPKETKQQREDRIIKETHHYSLLIRQTLGYR